MQPGHPGLPDLGRDAGTTLLELVVTMSIASVLMAVGLSAARPYLIAQRESGTTTEIRSALRNAAEQSLSEGRTYCVYFTSTTWAVYRANCTIAGNKVQGPNRVQDSSISLSSVAFPAPPSPIPNQTTACPAPGPCVYFYPRGTALAGSLVVYRPGKTYQINVEGLTGRVSLV